jgi:hypothetical protein
LSSIDPWKTPDSLSTWCRGRVMVTAVDPSLLAESRASAHGWTGETPVPLSYDSSDSSRGQGTRCALR